VGGGFDFARQARVRAKYFNSFVGRIIVHRTVCSTVRHERREYPGYTVGILGVIVAQGHKVLWTPPYHSDFQPINSCGRGSKPLVGVEDASL
jgi:hypothetical protein